MCVICKHQMVHMSRFTVRLTAISVNCVLFKNGAPQPTGAHSAAQRKRLNYEYEYEFTTVLGCINRMLIIIMMYFIYISIFSRYDAMAYVRTCMCLCVCGIVGYRLHILHMNRRICFDNENIILIVIGKNNKTTTSSMFSGQAGECAMPHSCVTSDLCMN